MKKLIISIIFSVFIVTNSWATYTGSIAGPDTLYGTGSWSTATLSWDISVNSDIWTYNYTFDVSEKAISHLIFEVSNSFGRNNILEGTTEGYELGIYGQHGGSNPGIPGSINGLKWDIDDDSTDESISIVSDRHPMRGNFYAKDGVESITIVSDRPPMWGDFYAKDGVERGTKIFAYNTQFGNDTLAPIGNGNAGGWALVPDTGSAPVPEPATMLLFGAGLIGLIGGGAGRRKYSRRSRNAEIRK